LTPGSGIRDGKNSDPGFGMNTLDLYFENLVSVFWVKIPKSESGSGILSTLDPGWKKSDPGSWIRDKHPGSATLLNPDALRN
jgi:hypothetical protein